MNILCEPQIYQEKENLYIQVRSAENRVISDEELKQLPYVTGPLASEWKYRQRSLKQLIRYLQKTGKQLSILDIGCGNGWMSHQLYQEGHSITGIDLNMVELRQAENVFGSSDQLQWVYGNVMSDPLPDRNYDIILLAASCQYFPDLANLTNILTGLLKPGGGIHLFDSVFYDNADSAEAARQRTLAYYNSLGYDAMANYYFHHDIATIKKLGFKKQRPGFFSNGPLQWWIKKLS